MSRYLTEHPAIPAGETGRSRKFLTSVVLAAFVVGAVPVSQFASATAALAQQRDWGNDFHKRGGGENEFRPGEGEKTFGSRHGEGRNRRDEEKTVSRFIGEGGPFSKGGEGHRKHGGDEGKSFRKGGNEHRKHGEQGKSFRKGGHEYGRSGDDKPVWKGGDKHRKHGDGDKPFWKFGDHKNPKHRKDKDEHHGKKGKHHKKSVAQAAPTVVGVGGGTPATVPTNCDVIHLLVGKPLCWPSRP